MSIIIFVGLLGAFLVIFLRRPILSMIGNNNRLVLRLQHLKWFQNHWLSGMFLFALNAVLFGSTCLLLYVLMYFLIPFVHLFVMFFAAAISIAFWLFIHKAWEGSKKNRLKMGALGSSFYMLSALLFGYLLATLKPSYPGEDTFMVAVGLVFAIIVTSVAFMGCFVITGFSIKTPK